MPTDTAEAAPADLVPRSEVPARWPVIGARHARRLTETRTIPSWRVGRRVFVSAADVAEYLAGCRRPSAREAAAMGTDGL